MSDWIILADGSEHYLSGVDMAHNQYHLETLAHHLAIINRFTGATTRAYSVAEHSLLCAEIAEQLGHPLVVQLACLMHDAHEAIVGDTSSPAKRTIGPAWSAFEAPHANALRRHFGLQSTFAAHRHTIHQIDLMALATERRDLTRWRADVHQPWAVLDTPGRMVPAADVNLTSARRNHRHWTEWRDEFIEHFRALDKACKRVAPTNGAPA